MGSNANSSGSVMYSISFRVLLWRDPVDLPGLDTVNCCCFLATSSGEKLTLLDNHEVISYPKKRQKVTARASHPYAIM